MQPMSSHNHIRLRVGRLRPRILPTLLEVPSKHLAWWNGALSSHFSELLELLRLQMAAPDFLDVHLGAKPKGGGKVGRFPGGAFDVIPGEVLKLAFRLEEEECTYRIVVPIGDPPAPVDAALDGGADGKGGGNGAAAPLYAGGQYAELPVLGFCLHVVVAPLANAAGDDGGDDELFAALCASKEQEGAEAVAAVAAAEEARGGGGGDGQSRGGSSSGSGGGDVEGGGESKDGGGGGGGGRGGGSDGEGCGGGGAGGASVGGGLFVPAFSAKASTDTKLSGNT